MRSLKVSIALLALLSVSAAKDELQISDLVRQHLNSIGSEQARAAVKTRVAEGTVQFRFLSGGAGTQDGKQVLVSEGRKLVSLLKLPNPSYHGERFVSDGTKTFVINMTPGVYSNFGQFVRIHDEILTEGLWGGTLSTGWALANLEDRHAKLHYQGLKNVDGRELHRVSYTPSKRTDLEIELYFEPGTFRHVLTTYELTINPQLAGTERENSQQQSTHYRLEERFSDFKDTDQLSLPRRWIVQFTSEVPRSSYRPNLGAAQASVTEFNTAETSISHNVTLDPKNFEIK
jgi:hypothetical protein